jgi:uncharacterized membrane protein
MSIRESMNNAIERSTVEASKVFELDEISTAEKIVLPLLPAVGHAADIATTIAGLRTGKFVEGNPVMKPIVGNLPLFIAVKLGVSAIAAVAIKKYQDGGHKNRARVVSALATAVGAAPAVSNLVNIRRAR